MRIEHIAFNVAEPLEVAAWYCRHLGFTIARGMKEEPWAHFLADERGRTVLEVYHNPKCRVPDYAARDPLELHVAFVCDDVAGTVARLVAAGASVAAAPVTAANGDTIAMLRDPWGLCIQLVKRAVPLQG